MLPSIAKIAELLGGDAQGGQVLCPGPGHTAGDRSLSIKLDGGAADGFVLHSFAGDDAIACRDYVRERLGLPEFEATKKKKKPNGGAQPYSPTVAKYVYRLADGTPYLQVHRLANKSGFPQYHWDGEKWISGKPKGPKVPYRLPELIAAAPTMPIYVVEGEKDCDALAKIGLMATCNSEGADNGNGNKWTADLNEHFTGRHVYIIPDNDAQGRAHAQHVAGQLDSVAASVRIVELPDLPLKGDVSDWLKRDSAGARLAKLAKESPQWEPGAGKTTGGDIASAKRVILELAGLSKLEYAFRRKRVAEDIGIGVAELDKIVAAERGDSKEKESAAALYEHWNVEAASAPVDTAILLRAIKEAVRRYVFMSDDQVVAVTLWIVFSWLHEHEGTITHSPILYVTSAEKDSGKSTLLGTLNFLAHRSLQSVDISGPALFRSIAKWQPCLIVDEADDALSDNPDLRSVINSGWTRGQGVIRCHPDTREPELFSTFAPKIVAMKGRKLPDTTLSRSIVISMKPRRADDSNERTADFNHIDNETFARLRSQLMRWTADNAEALAKATPEIPPGFYNRRRANWVPLLAIAEAGGEDWKKAARQAALAIEAVADTFDPSIGVELLRAIQGVFEVREKSKDPITVVNKDRVSSAALLSELVADETAPWATWNKGKPISQRQVAGLLKPYGIKPKTIKLKTVPSTPEGTTAKGYLLEWFVDAFSRFHTPSSPQTPDSSVTADTSLFSHDFHPSPDPSTGSDGDGRKCCDNNEVTAVTAKTGVGPKRGIHDPQSRSAMTFPIMGRWWRCRTWDRTRSTSTGSRWLAASNAADRAATASPWTASRLPSTATAKTPTSTGARKGRPDAAPPRQPPRPPARRPCRGHAAAPTARARWAWRCRAFIRSDYPRQARRLPGCAAPSVRSLQHRPPPRHLFRVAVTVTSLEAIVSCSSAGSALAFSSVATASSFRG